MRTKEIEIGTYEEWKAANETVAQTILEKYSDINVNYEGWYDFTLEDFCDKVEKIGFEVTTDEIQFSGFWSQGDGASFEGYINILKYLKATKQLTVYRPLVRAINCGYVGDGVGITRDSHHYSHENTCSLMDIEIYEDLSARAEELLSNLETELEEKRRELSIELYSELAKAHDYLTSEESVSETLIANEYEFDEYGAMA